MTCKDLLLLLQQKGLLSNVQVDFLEQLQLHTLDELENRLQVECDPYHPWLPLLTKEQIDCVKQAAWNNLFIGAGSESERFLIRHRKIGKGGQGQVHLASDQSHKDKMLVAIKVLHLTTNNEESFYDREVRHLMEINHPHVARYHSHGTLLLGVSYVAMAYIKGYAFDKAAREFLTLQALLPRGYTLKRILELCRDSASGLGCLHDRGMLHRDIKPANIIIDQVTQRAVIVDLGLSKWIGHDTEVTQPGTMRGTILFMDPRTLLHGIMDTASDIYSFGAVMYHLVTGVHANYPRYPLHVNKYSQVKRWGEQKLKPIIMPSEIRPDIPVEWCQLITCCLHPDPACRPRSMNDVIETLNNIKLPDLAPLNIGVAHQGIVKESLIKLREKLIDRFESFWHELQHAPVHAFWQSEIAGLESNIGLFTSQFNNNRQHCDASFASQVSRFISSFNHLLDLMRAYGDDSIDSLKLYWQEFIGTVLKDDVFIPMAKLPFV